MWKYFALLLNVLCFNIHAWCQPKWDRQMQIKSCSIDIKADMFTASTFIELEFYNPGDQEIEGLYQFELKPGQVITAFQLDLHGKYREGSIEEKWKATTAYNTIVGKRIDPALLTMEQPNHYSLRIYPVPAKGSRKVTMTIQQLMTREKNSLQYLLPLKFNEVVPKFRLNILVNSVGMPASKELIAGQLFNNLQQNYQLNWNTENIQVKTPIVFTIPLPTTSFYCTRIGKQNTDFALYFHPTHAKEQEINPKHLVVYWDVSASLSKRNTSKEINFLKQFIAYHRIRKLTIVIFNHKLLDTAVFDEGDNFNGRWQEFLQKQEYDGATQLGCIDMSIFKADMHMLFSDGKNSYGRAQPRTGTALVYAVHASANADLTMLSRITGASGGKVIDLNKTSISGSVASSSKAEIWLMSINSASGRTIFEQSLPAKLDGPLMINGTMNNWNDTLSFHYGNNNGIIKTEKMIIEAEQQCSSNAIDKMTLLNNFDEMIRSYAWTNIIELGIRERIVTPYTAYIVLERTEDYVRYNITPPKELEAECEKMNYVKRDTRTQLSIAKKADEFDVLNNVVAVYNQRLRTLNNNDNLISIEREDIDGSQDKPRIASGVPGATAIEPSSLSDNSNLNFELSKQKRIGRDEEEAFIVGYGSMRRSNAVAYGYIGGKELRNFSSLDQALEGRVSGLRVMPSNFSWGKESKIQIRGYKSVAANSGPLYILDGIPVDGNINNYIMVNDIDNISVMTDIAATTLYGSRAANGAVLITSKEGKRYYRNIDLSKDQKDIDVPNYLGEMATTAYTEKKMVYLQLREQYGGVPGFYFEVAKHFYASGMKTEAMEVLMNAAEASNGSNQVLRAMGYMFESWGQFDQAIEIYQQLMDDYPDHLHSHRDLAWAYYQKKNYQKTIDLLYNAIKQTSQFHAWWNVSVKAMMLAELNAIIAMHGGQLDTSAIPTSLIQPVSADLRVMLDCNKGSVGVVSIREPGGTIVSHAKPVSKSGGVLNSDIYGYSFYNSGPAEYQVKHATNGKYKISLNYYDYQSYPGIIPTMIRMVVFRNFGTSNQQIGIQNMILGNKYGETEIGEVRWQKK